MTDNMKIPLETRAKIATQIAIDMTNPYGYAGYLESHFEVDNFDISLTIKEKHD